KASLTADGWQTDAKEVKLNVLTQTHDDEGQAAKSTLKVYKLQQPEKVQRAPLEGGRRYPRLPRPDGKEPKPDPANPNSWALGEVVAERDVATDAAGKAEVGVKLPAGIYRAILETKDRFGKDVTARLPLQVFNPEA